MLLAVHIPCILNIFDSIYIISLFVYFSPCFYSWWRANKSQATEYVSPCCLCGGVCLVFWCGVLVLFCCVVVCCWWCVGACVVVVVCVLKTSGFLWNKNIAIILYLEVRR